ncbi:uncharacterized protein TNCT_486621 [Trichonephila clavata]|uniref:Uncharacterized protein n=2 Tax=Trichonephila clavata TaxID=2740835 RepID=A0A8X6IKR1_TRICU|nr:uncharacterized protein TNCT_465541 [Trichonephila clavata]GFQ96317.1 uncharacterized protein TNCT_692741 [Trichonephila clavata]GFR07713.1 uncharacterized protein TNCT_486621 [Trichonephila clavata]
MKRNLEEEESDDECPPPKLARREETDILQDLRKGLTETDNDSINRELLETQKQYFIMYMEKLMHQIPMGKAVIETVRKNGQENNFMCMYAASKTIIQALMNVKQSKAIKSVVDMILGGACRYVHEKVVSPMLNNVVHHQHLKRAYQVYQSSVKTEENDAELEMRCLLHCIHEVLEREEQCVKLVHPFQAQMTQQMKAISEYVVALLVSVTDPKDDSGSNEIVLHSATAKE